MILNGIIWKKTDMNTNSSEYFRIPGFSIIVSSEANNRTGKRHNKRQKTLGSSFASGISSDPGSTNQNPRIIKEE